MDDVENIFDINKTLHECFSKIKSLDNGKSVELIFEMHPTVPRELRGDGEMLLRLLNNVLTFVFNNTQKNEMVLILNAPEDFLYQESISFKIEDSGINKEKVVAFLKKGLGTCLNKLDGEILYDENDIHLSIPFSIGELGFRRHYRLPSKSMLQKKVLLIFQSENITNSIMKMFKYFPYDVDLGFKEYKEDKTDLSKYDLVIIEEELVTESFSKIITKIQEVKNLKFVILIKHDSIEPNSTKNISKYLLKPVTQESIFELIIAVFGDDKFNKDINNDKDKNDVKIAKTTPDKQKKSSINNIIEEKKSRYVMILDTRLGLENAKNKGLTYSKELEHFLDSFDKSDLYFREIVNEKQKNKIKEFCTDLESQSKIIGAESMQKFADIISLIFVYDKLDMLPIYPGRYHIELNKLINEIKKYLYIR